MHSVTGSHVSVSGLTIKTNKGQNSYINLLRTRLLSSTNLRELLEGIGSHQARYSVVFKLESLEREITKLNGSKRSKTISRLPSHKQSLYKTLIYWQIKQISPEAFQKLPAEQVVPLFRNYLIMNYSWSRICESSLLRLDSKEQQKALEFFLQVEIDSAETTKCIKAFEFFLNLPKADKKNFIQLYNEFKPHFLSNTQVLLDVMCTLPFSKPTFEDIQIASHKLHALFGSDRSIFLKALKLLKDPKESWTATIDRIKPHLVSISNLTELLITFKSYSTIDRFSEFLSFSHSISEHLSSSRFRSSLLNSLSQVHHSNYETFSTQIGRLFELTTVTNDSERLLIAILLLKTPASQREAFLPLYQEILESVPTQLNYDLLELPDLLSQDPVGVHKLCSNLIAKRINTTQLVAMAKPLAKITNSDQKERYYNAYFAIVSMFQSSDFLSEVFYQIESKPLESLELSARLFLGIERNEYDESTNMLYLTAILHNTEDCAEKLTFLNDQFSFIDDSHQKARLINLFMSFSLSELKLISDDLNRALTTIEDQEQKINLLDEAAYFELKNIQSVSLHFYLIEPLIRSSNHKFQVFLTFLHVSTDELPSFARQAKLLFESRGTNQSQATDILDILKVIPKDHRSDFIVAAKVLLQSTTSNLISQSVLFELRKIPHESRRLFVKKCSLLLPLFLRDTEQNSLVSLLRNSYEKYRNFMLVDNFLLTPTYSRGLMSPGTTSLLFLEKSLGFAKK